MWMKRSVVIFIQAVFGIYAISSVLGAVKEITGKDENKCVEIFICRQICF